MNRFRYSFSVDGMDVREGGLSIASMNSVYPEDFISSLCSFDGKASKLLPVLLEQASKMSKPENLKKDTRGNGLFLLCVEFLAELISACILFPDSSYFSDTY